VDLLKFAAGIDAAGEMFAAVACFAGAFDQIANFEIKFMLVRDLVRFELHG
jgi:hypothetical protein